MPTIQEVRMPAKSWSAANIALWVLQVLLAVAFLGAAGAKLSGSTMMVEQFDKLGFGQWFRYVTGALEVVAAVLLLIPKLNGFGALLLVPIMIGAAAAHLIVFKDSPAPPLVFLGLAAVVVFGRRGQFASTFRPSLKKI